MTSFLSLMQNNVIFCGPHAIWAPGFGFSCVLTWYSCVVKAYHYYYYYYCVNNKMIEHDWLVTVLIYDGNRTKWSSIWYVIIRVINKIRQPRSRGPIIICLITSMITDWIGCNEVIFNRTGLIGQLSSQ